MAREITNEISIWRPIEVSYDELDEPTRRHGCTDRYTTVLHIAEGEMRSRMFDIHMYAFPTIEIETNREGNDPSIDDLQIELIGHIGVFVVPERS